VELAVGEEQAQGKGMEDSNSGGMVFEQCAEGFRGESSWEWLIAGVDGAPIDSYRCVMLHRQSSRIWPLAAFI
jgi:hypothetical protein